MRIVPLPATTFCSEFTLEVSTFFVRSQKQPLTRDRTKKSVAFGSKYQTAAIFVVPPLGQSKYTRSCMPLENTAIAIEWGQSPTTYLVTLVNALSSAKETMLWPQGFLKPSICWFLQLRSAITAHVFELHLFQPRSVSIRKIKSRSLRAADLYHFFACSNRSRKTAWSY